MEMKTASTQVSKHPIIIVLVIVIAVIAGPIIIHLLFKTVGPSWLVAKWSAGEILQYYGTIITAIIAIAGLYLTFQDNRRSIREQSRLDKLPYFSLTTLNYDVRNPLFGTTTDKEIDSKGEVVLKPKDNKQEYYYREEKLKAALITIRKGVPGIETKIPETDKKLILNGGVSEQRMAQGMIGIVNEPMIYVPIILQNVGNGAAMGFRVGLNKLINGCLIEPKYLSSTSVNEKEEFYLGFFALNEGEENVGEYLLEIIYRDMFDNKYRQSTKFIISYENKSILTNMEVEFKQEMINL
ncbi:hypothetical protein [Butyrivibrio fibrisolvens]|uniref:hypothetical protein n=1 Tax=Butyrivibrio fibrisolvens TaxID=831 RepID=UPI0003FE4371|nr:hypothetical protein [Butyrivibrio fibrisolvens]